MNCRWVGVSVDAGTRETFEKVHGVDCFDKVIENLRLLTKIKNETGSKIDIAYKFLINPINWKDLYEACKLAKEIGIRDFHARPVDLERKDFQAAMNLNYDMEAIHELFQKCHDLEEGDEFRVFTVMHKYSPDFRVIHTFRNCSSSPLMIQCCADGNVYVCADHRLEPRFKLCSHHPEPIEILNFWGGDRHREILKSIKVSDECARCFVPGTKVTTSDGVKKIESIKKGDLVISGEGKIRKVTRTYKNKYKGKLILINNFGNNEKILATPYHKFNSIKTDLCTARDTKKCLGNSCGVLINMKNYQHDLERCKDPSKKYKIKEIKASDLTKKHLLILPKIKTNGEKYIKTDLAWVLGMYIAEGHYDVSNRHHAVRFYLS